MAGAPENAAEANRILRDNTSPRFLELDRLERYADGCQYDGRPSFWNDEGPLFDRAPCVVVPIAKTAARSFTEMVLGEGRFPTLTSHTEEDDSVFDDRFGLSKEDSAVLDRFVRCIVKQADLPTACDSLLMAGQIAKTAVAIACVRNGRLSVEMTRAKWCTRDTDPKCPDVTTRLEIRYPYLEEFEGEDGKRAVRCMLYRRVIDEIADTTYKPAVANKDGRQPDRWTVDADKTHEHGFGFCPVVWYPFMKEVSTVAEDDGVAIHQELTDEIDALNFAMSVRHRASLYIGDPQIIETGVDENVNPAPMGIMASGPDGQPDHPANADWRRPSGGGGLPARKKGPGVLWRYPSKDSEVTLLSLPEGALKPIEENADDLVAMIAEALSWVPIDPKDMSLGANLSGRAIEWLKMRQVDKANRIRKDFGKRCLLPLVDLLLRIALAMPDGAVRIAGIEKVRPILDRFNADTSAGKEWIPPDFDLKWGPYFAATDVDAKATGDNVRADYQAGIITLQTAVEKVAPYYGIQDPAQYHENLEAEQAEKAGGLHAALGALGAATKGDDASGAEPSVGQPKPATGGAPMGGPAPQATGADATAAPVAAPIHERGATTAGIAETVYKQLAEDYPADAIAWVRAASWSGPMEVPLDSIDFSNRDNWAASDDDARVSGFEGKIANDGFAKPIVLVNEPNNNKLMVVDGHHRLLAYEKLGQAPMAYVASVGTVDGPWRTMHDSQRAGQVEPENGPETKPSARV